MKSGFWKTDWLFGLAIALVLLLGSNSGRLQNWPKPLCSQGGAVA